MPQVTQTIPGGSLLGGGALVPFRWGGHWSLLGGGHRHGQHTFSLVRRLVEFMRYTL